MTDREELLHLLARDSFRLGRFQLSSGGFSDYYVDCRVTTLHPRGALLTGRLLLRALAGLPGPAPAAVGGLTLGADPIVMSVVVQSALADSPLAPLGGFLVRKQGKDHGAGRRFEGNVARGARVAIVDDVCTTAASTILAVEAAWQEGLEVVAVRCLLEREEAGGRANLDALWQGQRQRACPFAALYTAAEVRAVHERLIAAAPPGSAPA